MTLPLRKATGAKPPLQLRWGIVGPGNIARKFARDLRVATGGRKPGQISAIARLSDTGVDEWLAATLRYAHGGVAQFVCSLSSTFDNSLVIGGDKGFIRVPANFIHGKEAILDSDGHAEFFTEPPRGEGFENEIEEAMRCVRAGAIESPLMPHADTLATMEAMDEIRRQIGLVYPDEGYES